MGNFINELRAWQQIPLELINDDDLSIQARFIYVKMASKPDGWDFYQTPLAQELRLSIGTLQKYLTELIDSGWLVREQQAHGECGRFGAAQYILKAQLSVDDLEHRTVKNTVRQNLPYRKKHRTVEIGVQKQIDNIETEVSTETKPHTHTESACDKEKLISGAMGHYPNLRNLKQPTASQWAKMFEKCGCNITKVYAILQQMNNKPLLMKTYAEVYTTFCSFLENDKLIK